MGENPPGGNPPGGNGNNSNNLTPIDLIVGTHSDPSNYLASTGVGDFKKKEVVIDNSTEATKHYFTGGGAPARIGPNTTRSLLESPEFKKAHEGIKSGQSNNTGKFSVNMTDRVFHIGRTNVSYSISSDKKSVTYTLYDGDGFWDPDFIDEKFFDGNPNFKPDGPGPNLERMGGTPYHYIPTTVTIPFGFSIY
jgi:hypothetical protein